MSSQYIVIYTGLCAPAGKYYLLKLDLSSFSHSGSAFLSADNYRIINAENQSNCTFVNNMTGVDFTERKKKKLISCVFTVQLICISRICNEKAGFLTALLLCYCMREKL